MQRYFKPLLLFVLGLIALNLSLFSAALFGWLPAAQSADGEPKSAAQYAKVPLNPDGSITVRLAPEETMSVNIEQVRGRTIYGGIPVEGEGTLDVNLRQLGGRSVHNNLPVVLSK